MTEPDIPTRKKLLRKTVVQRINNLPANTRKVYEQSLKKNFLEFISRLNPNSYGESPVILSYMPLPDEPAITEIISSLYSFRIALPVTEDDNTLTPRLQGEKFKLGRYNIPQPYPDSPEVPKDKIALAIIPGRAFSPDGKRLGRGKGYYDRFLTTCDCLTVGLAYDEQIFPDIPVTAHDRCLDYIITPTAIYPQLDD